MTTFKEFRKTLLASIYQSLEDDVSADCDPLELVERLKIPYRVGWVRQAIEQMEEDQFVKASWFIGGGPDGGVVIRLTGRGIEAAEELLEDGWSISEQAPGSESEPAAPNPSEVVPASDRVVTLDHNSPAYRDVIDILNDVSSQIRGNNELAAKTPLAFGQHTAEIEAGKRLLDAPQVDVGAVESTLISGLKWFAEQAAGTAVGPLILFLLTALGGLFNVSWWG